MFGSPVRKRLLRYRWLDYQYADEDTEREHIKKSAEIIKEICGKHPKGMYQGKPNTNTRR